MAAPSSVQSVSSCRHLAITDTPIIRTAVKSYIKIIRLRMFYRNKLTLLRTLATLGPYSVRSKGTWRVFTKCKCIKDLRRTQTCRNLVASNFFWKLCYGFIFGITRGIRTLCIKTKAVAIKTACRAKHFVNAARITYHLLLKVRMETSTTIAI